MLKSLLLRREPGPVMVSSSSSAPKAVNYNVSDFVKNWIMTQKFPAVNHHYARSLEVEVTSSVEKAGANDEQAANGFEERAEAEDSDQPLDLSCKRKRIAEDEEEEDKQRPLKKRKRLTKRKNKRGESIVNNKVSVIRFGKGKNLSRSSSDDEIEKEPGYWVKVNNGGHRSRLHKKLVKRRRNVKKATVSTANTILDVNQHFKQSLNGAYNQVFGGGWNAQLMMWKRALADKMFLKDDFGIEAMGKAVDAPTNQTVIYNENIPIDVLVDHHFAKSLGLETYSRILKENSKSNVSFNSGKVTSGAKRRISETITSNDSKRMKLPSLS